MYKVTPYYKKLCTLFWKKLHIFDEDCEIYTIWNFFPKAEWRTFKTFWGEGALVNTQWFPIVYWMIFTISILGMIRCLNEFIHSCLYTQKPLTMWRKRKYYVLPCAVVRKCRIVGSIFMFNNWFLLWYALITVTPQYMWPWLAMSIISLTYELIIWLGEVFTGITKLDAETVLSFVLPILCCFLVHCIKNVFERAIELNETGDLYLWNTSH